MKRATAGTPPAASQIGLTEEEKAQGLFFACLCKPTEAISIEEPGETEQFFQAIIDAVDQVSETVLRIRLSASSEFAARAGQFVTVERPDGVSRQYSLAEVDRESQSASLHVRLVPGGAMSEWFSSDASHAAAVRISAPKGRCFYDLSDRHTRLVLAGTGTGLAPLFGIVRDALEAGHEGAIQLFHGGLSPADLYLHRHLQELAATCPVLTYTGCIAEGGGDGEEYYRGSVIDAVLASTPSFDLTKVYLCGNPAMVKEAQRRIFLAGASSSKIFCDAFAPTS